jgi:hypothetical protein
MGYWLPNWKSRITLAAAKLCLTSLNSHFPRICLGTKNVKNKKAEPKLRLVFGN